MKNTKDEEVSARILLVVDMSGKKTKIFNFYEILYKDFNVLAT